MTWVAVPSLLEGRSQLDKRFPKRDKSSEGLVGDLAHQSSPSSHNPDLTGNPEFADGDNKDEVRAADFDKDLRDAGGVTMEQVVQLWITKARAGKMPWIRYIIYNKRIWERYDGFKTHAYTGSNDHSDHVHVNNEYSNYADTVTGTNWYLSEVGKPAPVPVPKPAPAPAPKPTFTVLKKGSTGPAVKNLQQFLRNVFPAYQGYVTVRRGQLIDVDGDFGPQTAAWVYEFQTRTRLLRNGIVNELTAKKMREYGYKY